MIPLPAWLDCALTVHRLEEASRWERQDSIARGWPVPAPEPWRVFLGRCWRSYRRRPADAHAKAR